MDAAILADTTICYILQCMSFLKPPNLLSTATHDMKMLEDIHASVLKAKQSQSQNSQSQDAVLTWLRKVKEVVIDFKDLMEDIQLKERITTAKKPFAPGTMHRNHVNKTVNEFERFNKEAQDLLSFPDDDEPHHESDETVVVVPVVGRENEKEEIIEQLIFSPVPMVAIVGVAGIGKTTLARLVSEAEQVKAHFALQIWHSKKTVDSIAAVDSAPTDGGGKRCLLVLDDLEIGIRSQDIEKLNQKLAEAGFAGAAVLITTRSNVPFNNKVKPYVLQGLKVEDSLSLFHRICRRGGSNDIIKSEIVNECFGVPRAIIFMARLLKGRDDSTPLSESDVPALRKQLLLKLYNDLPSYQKQCFAYCSLFPPGYLINAERLIQLWMAEGFLSWNNDNVSLEDLEEFGQSCFDNLVPFVFQEQKEKEVEDKHSDDAVYYRINPLMHEVAGLVAGDENVTVDSEGKRVQGSGVLRVSFEFALTLSCGIPDSVFEEASKLRSILLPAVTNKLRLPHEVKMTTSTCDNIFETFKATLRVLDLHDLGIKTIKSSIGEMKRLRYLDLSHSNIEKLPSSITKLTHLQTLKLSRCHLLKELPKDLGELSCLMHLDIEGCLELTHMPPGIRKLTGLQTLSLFVASKKQVMGGLKELTDLERLRGNLEILHLEQFNFTQSKEEAYCLKNKQQLEGLTLRWDHDDGGEEEKKVNNRLHRGGSVRGGDAIANDNDNDKDKDKDKESLEYLEPHPNLRSLLIVGYNGCMFSEWISSVEGLVKLSMNDCPRCQFLPPMDQLPSLKVLQLRRMDSLEFIAKNDENEKTPSEIFPSLKELTISDCPQLRSWWKYEKSEKDRPIFPCISKLHIQSCPILACMPLYPYLDEELVVVDSSGVKSVPDTRTAETTSETSSILPFSKLKCLHIAHLNQSLPDGWFNNFTSLEKLHIRDSNGLEYVPEGFKSLVSLQFLTIERCLKLDLNKDTTEWKGLEKLRSLTIRGISSLQSLPCGVENVYSLTELMLYECPNLTSLPQTIGSLLSLTKLVISDCEKLESLPKGMENLKSLKILIITGCPLLLTRCQPETGDDWPQIAHIEHILVKETSHIHM